MPLPITGFPVLRRKLSDHYAYLLKIGRSADEFHDWLAHMDVKRATNRASVAKYFDALRLLRVRGGDDGNGNDGEGSDGGEIVAVRKDAAIEKGAKIEKVTAEQHEEDRLGLVAGTSSSNDCEHSSLDTRNDLNPITKEQITIMTMESNKTTPTAAQHLTRDDRRDLGIEFVVNMGSRGCEDNCSGPEC